MKKIAITILLGLSITSVSHALKDGDRLACGRIYYKSDLRGDTSTNFATLKEDNATTRTQGLVPGHGDGVYRTN